MTLKLATARTRVVVLSPPIERSGGIGTLFTYARPYLEKYVDLRFLDTRGHYRKPALSLISLTRSLLILTGLRMRGRVDVVHMNLGAGGAAVRKLTALAFASYILRLPCVMQLHAAEFDQFYFRMPRAVRTLMSRILGRATQVLTLGAVWQELILNISALHHENVRVLPMGVPDLRQLRGDAPLIPLGTDDYQYVLFAGEMGPRKGLPNLLAALADPRSSQIRAVIAGSGSVAQWRSEASRLGVASQCVFVGLIQPQLVHQLLAATDCLILPSQAEGLPVSVLEAFSASQIIIATAAGALGEYARDGIEFLLLPDTSPESIAAQLSRLSDVNLRRQLQASARALWEGRFRVEETSRELAQIWIACAS